MFYFRLPPLLWCRPSEGLVGALARYPLSVHALILVTMDDVWAIRGMLYIRGTCWAAWRSQLTVFTEVTSVLRYFNSNRLRPNMCNAWIFFRYCTHISVSWTPVPLKKLSFYLARKPGALIYVQTCFNIENRGTTGSFSRVRCS